MCRPVTYPNAISGFVDATGIAGADDEEFVFALELPDAENFHAPKTAEGPRQPYTHIYPVLRRLSQLGACEQQVLRQTRSALALEGFLGSPQGPMQGLQGPKWQVHAVAELLANAQSDPLVAVSVRSGLSNADLAKCLSTLTHNVIIINGLADYEIVLDIDFRCHFAIANAPELYNALLARHVPSIMVGPIERFKHIVALMADIMSSVYVQLGMTAPPWRSFKALMTKFQPTFFTETLVPPSHTPWAPGTPTHTPRTKTPAAKAATTLPANALETKMQHHHAPDCTVRGSKAALAAVAAAIGKPTATTGRQDRENGPSTVRSLLDMVFQDAALQRKVQHAMLSTAMMHDAQKQTAKPAVACNTQPTAAIGGAAFGQVTEKEVCGVMVKTVASMMVREQQKRASRDNVDVAEKHAELVGTSPCTVLAAGA